MLDFGNLEIYQISACIFHWLFACPQLFFRWFGGSLDVVRSLQRYTLLFRTLQKVKF